MNRSKHGFTLLEILLVVAAIGILAGIVILAINPSKQLAVTRNAQRESDVNTLLNAIYQYAIDNNGNPPSNIDSVTGTSQVIGTVGSGADSTCTNASTTGAAVDLGPSLVSTYLVDIPYDPRTGSDDNTDYYVNKLANGRIVLGACDPEQSATIEISR